MEEQHIVRLSSWENTWCVFLLNNFLCIRPYELCKPAHCCPQGPNHLLFLKLIRVDLLCNTVWKAFNIWRDHKEEERTTGLWHISVCLSYFGTVFVLCCVSNACWVQSLHKHELSEFGKFAFFLFFWCEDLQMGLYTVSTTQQKLNAVMYTLCYL